MATVLIVDDVAAMADQYAFDLRRVGDFSTVVANGGKAALQILDGEPVDCVILDLEMPVMDGFEVLSKIRESGNTVPVIVYTGAGNFDRCVRAIQMGAYSFIDKDEPITRVVNVIKNALEHNMVSEQLAYVNRSVSRKSRLIGSSPAMSAMRDQISRIASIPSPVLILGESGGGKEVVAREIHSMSERKGKPFFAINCGALPGDLIESELFGHERGAFTGADKSRKGAFELASGGTIFLDEIGELPLQAQAVLLRVLEQKEIRRVGGDKSIKVDARVVAATNRDLDKASIEGKFREDLFYRLNVHIINVPPLRDRPTDIAELANHFVSSICTDFGMARKTISDAAIAELCGYDWSRNNVRELRNVIERMIIASDSDTIEANAIPPLSSRRATGQTFTLSGSFQEQKLEAERFIVRSALKRNDGHITNTAKDLGLADHASLLKVMRRLDIR